MKFIHITDPHLTKSNQLFNIKVTNQLAIAVDHITKNHSDAELCVITGDLTHWSEPEAYADLQSTLQRLPMPWHILIGNLDNRQLIKKIFPNIPVDENGFLQYIIPTSAGYFIVLDTIDEGFHHGIICEKRLAWLQRNLKEINNKNNVYLFMHHAPMSTEISGLDHILLKNADRFFQIIKTFRSIKHIFFGHLHRSFHGNWHNISFSTVKGTAHQVAADFAKDAPLSGSRELPAYAVVFLRKDGVFIHDISYLEENTKFDYE